MEWEQDPDLEEEDDELDWEAGDNGAAAGKYTSKFSYVSLEHHADYQYCFKWCVLKCQDVKSAKCCRPAPTLLSCGQWPLLDAAAECSDCNLLLSMIPASLYFKEVHQHAYTHARCAAVAAFAHAF